VFVFYFLVNNYRGNLECLHFQLALIFEGEGGHGRGSRRSPRLAAILSLLSPVIFSPVIGPWSPPPVTCGIEISRQYHRRCGRFSGPRAICIYSGSRENVFIRNFKL